MNISGNFKVVAIGASSGGLNAVRTLLRAAPSETGCAFLLVQHLDPRHESLLSRLLMGDTKMPVMQAVDGTPIQPEHMYVIPPGFFLSVSDGNIHLQAPRDGQVVRFPFDFLLRSLAREYGSRAVAVVLSGTGSDGAGAINGVLAAGGQVFAQDPNEAEFDGMPLNAIAVAESVTVLPAGRILESIANVGSVVDGAGYAGTAGEKMAQLPEIVSLLRVSTGNNFSSYKNGTLKRRIKNRIASLGIKGGLVETYLDVLRENEAERHQLAKELLINVTGFFRDPKVFQLLREEIIPRMLAAKAPGDIVRIWVVGCSTGEEAYSLAILALDLISSMGINLKLQIFASDADPDAVAVAREGYYSTDAIEHVPREFVKSFFVQHDMGYAVTPQLRASVIFTEQNVITDPPFSRIDMISCRNLLIYLENEAQTKVLALFGFALRENGILVLGKSESVGRLGDHFKLISKSEQVYHRVGHSRASDVRLNFGLGQHLRAPPSTSKGPIAIRQNVIADLVRDSLLAKYMPAAILINRHYEYLYSAGPTERIFRLATGPASLDLFALIPKSLHNKVRSAIHRASQDHKPFSAIGARLERNNTKVELSIHVEPLVKDGEDLFLISFIEEPKRNQHSPSAAGGQNVNAVRVGELEAELDETRDELQGAIHNLEIAAEEQKLIAAEALSLSEEYQTTNEELITSKEELQSLNEELTALNNQLQETLERQKSVSDDLENVLYSTDVPTLFLDSTLNIRFFTPATRLLFNIISSDVGRPFSDLSTQVHGGDLRSDALTVLETGGSVDKDVAAGDGSWYVRRIKPYLGQRGRVEGVVITFLDMSVQKRLADDSEAAKKLAEHASESKSHFLAAASHDLRQPIQTLKLLQGLLEKTVQDNKSRALVTRMEDTLESMSGILKTVLDINQIEAGIVQPKLESFSIAGLLRLMQEDFSDQAQGKGLDFRVSSCDVAIFTDPRLLDRVLRNLISNALKYTRHGKVLLGCRRSGSKLRVEVWDTGIGIPHDQIDKVFADYYQFHDTISSQERGLGLGLAIVKRLSDLLGLDVSLRSKSNSGSMFSITVDRAGSGTPLTSFPLSQLRSERREIGRAVSVLIVEDEPSMRSLLRMGLEQAGFSAVVAANVAEALDEVGEDKFTPDVILADYNLSSGADGLAVIESIRRQIGRDIPSVVLTGDISSKMLQRFSEYNIPYLNKPAKLAEVVHAIDELLLAGSEQSPEWKKQPPASNFVTGQLIEIVDDEEEVRSQLRDVFEQAGWVVMTYGSGEEYLSLHKPEWVSCAIIDAYLPGTGGIELLRILSERRHRFPVIIVTGRSDVHMAVDAMKYGAVDFVEKPFSADEILVCVQKAVELARDNSARAESRDRARASLAVLTRRQRQILDRIIIGQPNKIIAAELNLSRRTVEHHRASIMRRTGSTSLSSLLRLVVAAEE